MNELVAFITRKVRLYGITGQFSFSCHHPRSRHNHLVKFAFQRITRTGFSREPLCEFSRAAKVTRGNCRPHRPTPRDSAFRVRGRLQARNPFLQQRNIAMRVPCSGRAQVFEHFRPADRFCYKRIK